MKTEYSPSVDCDSSQLLGPDRCELGEIHCKSEEQHQEAEDLLSFEASPTQRWDRADICGTEADG